MAEQKHKKKKKRQSILLAELNRIVAQSLKVTIDKALDDIFKDWK